MHKIIIILLIFINLALPENCTAQIFPKEDSKLCYRIIGLSFPARASAVKYNIEIATGDYIDESSFEKNITVALYSKTNRVIAEVPYFGCQYTWRVTSVTQNNIKTKSPFYHFSTKITPDVDSAVTRLRVTSVAEKYKDAYVFLDGARVLYDMKGKPVWFLPGTDQPRNQSAYPRDMKLTPQGTITFITGYQPYEISYDGDLLWLYKGNKPGQPIDTFHHEFTRFNNGHYMGMLNKDVLIRLPGFKDSIAKNARDSTRFYKSVLLNTLVEYDAANHLIWQWDGLKHIPHFDLFYFQNATATFDSDLHENAFYFDEKHKVVYISLRNTDQVIKAKYPEGNVLNIYNGRKDAANIPNGLFCGQHSCKVSKEGYLYLFNNNICSEKHTPEIAIFRESAPGKNKLEKIWSYPCTIDDPDMAKEHLSFISGGSVQELPGGELLASMSEPYSKVFIVNRDKKILWSAIPEKYDATLKKWGHPVELYRASIITTQKELEQLIWNSEKNITPGTDL